MATSTAPTARFEVTSTLVQHTTTRVAGWSEAQPTLNSTTLDAAKAAAETQRRTIMARHRITRAASVTGWRVTSDRLGYTRSITITEGPGPTRVITQSIHRWQMTRLDA